MLYNKKILLGVTVFNYNKKQQHYIKWSSLSKICLFLKFFFQIISFLLICSSKYFPTNIHIHSKAAIRSPVTAIRTVEGYREHYRQNKGGKDNRREGFNIGPFGGLLEWSGAPFSIRKIDRLMAKVDFHLSDSAGSANAEFYGS